MSDNLQNLVVLMMLSLGFFGATALHFSLKAIVRKRVLDLFLALLMTSATAQAAQPVAADLFDQRASYISAVEKYAANRTTEADRLAKSLQDYPLYPYLKYHRLRVRLNNVSGKQMSQFAADHSTLPVSPLIFNRWLKQQGAKRRWKTFLK